MNTFTLRLCFTFTLSFSSLCFAASTERVSISSGGIETDSYSSNASVSANGNVVAFVSNASTLVADDSNGGTDIFVRDMARSITTRVNVSSTGEQADGLSTNPAISQDGRFIVFESNAANLVPNDTNGTTDIFLHDRLTGVTERISYSSEFGEANQDSHAPSISADGRYVAYYSYASNLVAADNNGTDDIFIYDRQQALTERLSAVAGVEGNGASYFPQMSADGRYVSFYSYADNLVPDDTNGMFDIFMYDRTTGTMERISVNSNGEQANNHSFLSSISADGRYVAFESSATNLVSGDFNRRSDIFLRDRVAQSTRRISLRSDGSEAMGGSRSPKVSADGNYVVFSSIVDLLIGTDTNMREDVYLYKIDDGSLELISVDSDDNLGDYNSSLPTVNMDGARVAFQSTATNLVVGDSNAQDDIFVRTRGPINAPPVADAGADLNIYFGEQVVLDGSASFDPEGAPLTFTWTIELAPAGSSAVLSSPHAQSTALAPDMLGDYVVSLVVSDGVNTSMADEIFIHVIENLPPVALISANPLTGDAPLTVMFSGSGSSDPEGSPLSYAWDFGVEGAASTEEAPVFTYTSPGTYTVVLTAQDDFGNIAEDVVQIVVTAANQPPTLAPYTATPAQGPAPLSVSFIANASDPDGDTLSYFWDFGDGANSTEENPQHVFYDAGSYSVTLQVSDGEFTTSAQVYVSVESSLTIEGIEAELDLGKRHHSGKLKLEIQFSGAEPLQATDRVRVAFGELTLLDTPLAKFEAVDPGVYIYKRRHVYAKLDFNKHSLKISQRLKSGAVEIGQPTSVMMSFGQAMAIEQVTLNLEEDDHHDGKPHRGHVKFCKRHSDHDHH